MSSNTTNPVEKMVVMEEKSPMDEGRDGDVITDTAPINVLPADVSFPFDEVVRWWSCLESRSEFRNEELTRFIITNNCSAMEKAKRSADKDAGFIVAAGHSQASSSNGDARGSQCRSPLKLSKLFGLRCFGGAGDVWSDRAHPDILSKPLGEVDSLKASRRVDPEQAAETPTPEASEVERLR
ncbi:uncharacterized protein A4U43_C08F18020 [Asparagus officinalis]|nr:uncharacterized protein A4U43_C08F18020 [Asparagus officinalis]